MWGVPILSRKSSHLEYGPFSLSIIDRNIIKMSQRQERVQQMDKETNKQTKNPSWMQKGQGQGNTKWNCQLWDFSKMKNLHRACIPGIMNSFWLTLFKKVYSCIQNTSSSSVGLGTDMKPRSPSWDIHAEINLSSSGRTWGVLL